MQKKSLFLGALIGLLVLVVSATAASAALTMDATSVSSDGALTASGAAASDITIGSAAHTGTIFLGLSTAGDTVSIANAVNAAAQVVNIANGASAADTTVNIMSGVGTAGAGVLAIGNNTRVTTIGLGNIAPAAARTFTIAGGNSAVDDTVNILTGAPSLGTQTFSVFSGVATGGTQTLNLMTGTGGTKSINIGTGAVANTITIGNTTASTKITLNAGGAAAGNGVRNAGTRQIHANKSVAPVDCADAACNPTVTQILDASIFIAAASADRAFTLPTAQGAAGLVQGLPGTPAVGDIFTFVISNSGASTVTVTAGTGSTVAGNAVVGAGATKVVTCRVTAVTGDAETITCY